jgi:diguanylate cyclase
MRDVGTEPRRGDSAGPASTVAEQGPAASFSHKLTVRYRIALGLLALFIALGVVLNHVSITLQQRQVRISSLAAEQSRLFASIGERVRGLLDAGARGQMPESTFLALRQSVVESCDHLQANMAEILALDSEPVAGFMRLNAMTPIYRDVPHRLEEKTEQYLLAARQLAALSTVDLGARTRAWVPMDIAVSTGSAIQHSYDVAMAEAQRSARYSVALMDLLQRSAAVALMLILVLEGQLLFAPLVRMLEREETRNRVYQQTLQQQARTDQLTGLANRIEFQDLLDRCAANAVSGVLVLLDLDRFKPVNDLFGHLAGDGLLKVVSERIEMCMRGQGLAARLGGDEFALVFSKGMKLASLQSALAALARAIEQPVQVEGWEIQPAVSMGAVMFGTHEEHPDDLYVAADAALYRAKRLRCSFVIYDDQMRAQEEARRRMAMELRQGMQRNELCVHYQPQFELVSGRCCGFEALIRWQHPTRGLVTADSFIRVAERIGLVPEITRLVVDAVARDLRGWLDAGLDPGVVAINVPEEMFITDVAVKMLDESLTRLAVPCERICIEVTEDVFLNRDVDSIAERFAAMRDRGFRVAFDDFGTGHASLSHLKRFPFDELKIDRSFTCDIAMDIKSREIVRALLTIASNLGKSVIAEGIETAEQKSILVSEGCARGQGYLYSRSVTAVEAQRFMTHALPQGSSQPQATGRVSVRAMQPCDADALLTTRAQRDRRLA